MAAATQQCSVIRVDKKTSLLVYRDSNAPDSILQNGHEPSNQSQSFTSTLKSIFSPSSSNVFSASAASAKQEAERRKILGSGAGLTRTRSQSSPGTSQSSSTGGASPKLRFAPLPEPDRPRGRSASISCGVAARAALLRGETPTSSVPRETTYPTTTEAASAQVMLESAVESDEDEEEVTAARQQQQQQQEEQKTGRAICRNSTITKDDTARQTSPNSAGATEEEKGKWSDKLKRPFSKRRSSSEKTVTNRSSSPNVVYEVVSAEEADRMVEKGGARRGRADLKVVPESEREEDQWTEYVEHADAATRG